MYLTGWLVSGSIDTMASEVSDAAASVPIFSALMPAFLNASLALSVAKFAIAWPTNSPPAFALTTPIG